MAICLAAAKLRKPRLIAALCAESAFLALSGCVTPGSSFLDPGGIIAVQQRNWLIDILAILIIVVAPVFLGVPYCLWRYRRRGHGAYQPDWSFYRPLEYVIWGVPCLIVIMLSFLVAGPESRFSPYDKLDNGQPIRIQVIALNWKFLFIYQDLSVASVDRLAIPIGQSVRFDLTSDATMQSFAIPALGSQIYAMAGMVTQLNLRAERAGHFAGENTQFNGLGFQDQHFDVEAMPRAQFDIWIARLRKQPPMDAQSYGVIARQGSAKAAASALPLVSEVTGMPGFSSVPSQFFNSIVTKYSAGDKEMSR